VGHLFQLMWPAIAKVITGFFRSPIVDGFAGISLLVVVVGGAASKLRGRD
jgi:hypothetical protein